MEKNEFQTFALIIFMLLLLLPSVLSVAPGTTAPLATIEKCVGKAYVRVSSLQQIQDGEYTLEGCYSDAVNSWQCQCSPTSSTIISIRTLNTTRNVYNVAIDYSIADEILVTNETNATDIGLIKSMNEANKRQIRVDGFQIADAIPVAPKKEPFKMPVLTPQAFQTISIILLSILLLVIFAVLLVVKFVFNSPENSLDYIKPMREVPKKESLFSKLLKPRKKEVIPKKEIDDKEVEDILNKINKQ